MAVNLTCTEQKPIVIWVKEGFLGDFLMISCDSTLRTHKIFSLHMCKELG